MGKIMGKLKHNYNAFPELQTRFFEKQCVIWSFPPSFNEFHHKLRILKISGTIMDNWQWEIKLQQEVSPTELFQIQGDKSKVSLFSRDLWYSDACKNSTDFDAKWKGSESRQVAHRKSNCQAKWVKSWASWNITIMHFQNSKQSFLTRNASFGHFHQVSMNSITKCPFSKFQVQLWIIKNEK